MENEKRHILLTAAWFPSRTTTSGVFVKEQGEALCRAGHKVTVLLITYSSRFSKAKADPEFDRSALLNIVHLHVVFPLPGRFFADPNGYFKKVIQKKAISWMKKYATISGLPDVIHHHCLSDNAYVAECLAQAFNIPYVFTEHSNYFQYSELNRFNCFESRDDHQRFVCNAAARIAVSDVRARGYEKIFNAPFVAVSNMVQEIFDAPLSTAPKPSAFTFACVAIFDRRKRQDLLIRAFSKCFRGENVKLNLYGNGPLEAEYRLLIDELKMHDQISISGKQNREAIRAIFDSSHVAVLSSDQETFGVVLAEAMFRGVPVVSTICGGPEEIVTEESGVLCVSGNEQALSAALMEIKQKYAQFSPAKIRDYARSRFSEDVIIGELQIVYSSCVVKSDSH